MRQPAIYLPPVIAQEVYERLTWASSLFRILDRDPRVMEQREILARWEDEGGALR